MRLGSVFWWVVGMSWVVGSGEKLQLQHRGRNRNELCFGDKR